MRGLSVLSRGKPTPLPDVTTIPGTDGNGGRFDGLDDIGLTPKPLGEEKNESKPLVPPPMPTPGFTFIDAAENPPKLEPPEPKALPKRGPANV